MAATGKRRRGASRPRLSRRGPAAPRRQFFHAPAGAARWTPLLAVALGLLVTVAAARLLAWLLADPPSAAHVKSVPHQAR
jgi:hypothetical protein